MSELASTYPLTPYLRFGPHPPRQDKKKGSHTKQASIYVGLSFCRRPGTRVPACVECIFLSRERKENGCERLRFLKRLLQRDRWNDAKFSGQHSGVFVPSRTLVERNLPLRLAAF